MNFSDLHACRIPKGTGSRGVDLTGRQWTEVVAMVREQIGPGASSKHVLVVDKLPETRSGKVPGSAIRKFADGTEWKMPGTIDDPTALDDVSEALKMVGLAPNGATALIRE